MNSLGYTSVAYEAGRTDGQEWDCDGFDSLAAAAAEEEGWDEATIDATGSVVFGGRLGLDDDQINDRGERWTQAVAEYITGVRDAISDRAQAAAQ